MNKLKKAASLLIFVIITILTVVFRYEPKGKLWDDYKIIYVSKTTPSSAVEKILLEEGISEFVCLDNQRIPIMLAKNSPEETMLMLTLNKEQNKYLYQRQNYFFDSRGEYSVYYIPELYSAHIGNALNQLQKQGYDAGADTTLPYLFLLPVIICIFVIILSVFSKNRLYFILSCISPCVYIFCNAFYSSAISVIILILSLFIISNIFGRKGALKKLYSNILLIVALTVSLIASFSTAFLPGLFYILAIIGSACAFYLAGSLKSFSLRKTDFAPVFIRSASKISIYGGKSKIILPVTLVAAVLVFAYFAVGSFYQTGVTSDSSVLLPSSSTENTSYDSKLPVFEDFYRWNWNVLTSPYKSLNENSEADDEHVVYPRYELNDGLIQRTNQVMYYDNDFKNRIYEQIDSLDFYSIESVLKSQGNEFIPCYSNSGTYNISIFSIIMMITGFFVLLFIYFSAMIGKRGRR